MIKSCHYPAEIVMIGATGTGLTDLSLADVAKHRDHVQSIFYELSNEWLNEDVENDPLWHTFYEDEDFGPLPKEVIGYVATNICSGRNIPTTLLFQCLQVCLDYLKATTTQGYFLEIGSFITGKNETPVWYHIKNSSFYPRSSWILHNGIRRICNKILRKSRAGTPINYPDVRCGANMHMLRQQATNPVPIQITLEILAESANEQILTDVAEHFLKHICLYQPVLENFAPSHQKNWVIKTEKNQHNQPVMKLLLWGWLPDFNPIFAGLTTRCLLESCSVRGITIPLKIAIKFDLDK